MILERFDSALICLSNVNFFVLIYFNKISSNALQRVKRVELVNLYTQSFGSERKNKPTKQANSTCF